MIEYVSTHNVQDVVGITTNELVALAKRHKLAHVKLTPRAPKRWKTSEVLAAIEADRGACAAVDAKAVLAAAGLTKEKAA